MALDVVSASPSFGLEGGILLGRGIVVAGKNTGSDDSLGLECQLGYILTVLYQATMILGLSVCVRSTLQS